MGSSDLPRPGVARRAFLRGALGAGGAAMVGLLAACGGAATVTGSASTAASSPASSATSSAPASSAATSSSAVPSSSAVTSASAAGTSSASSSAAMATSAASAAAASTSSAATSSASATGSAAAKPTVAPAASIKDALKLNLGSEPDTIDPQKASFVGEIEVIMRVFSNLLTFDSAGNLVPEMATDIPKASTDGLTYTATLKDGLKYSDGSPLTAHDFEYGWKRHLDPTVAGEYAFTGYAIKGGEKYNTADPAKVSKADLQAMRDALGVKATDDKTIVFTLASPSPWFLSVLATWNGIPSRQSDVEKGGDKWTEPATYIGNGPYILRTWDHQSQMVFDANSNYYQGAPPIAKVQYLMINEPAVSFAAYKNGDVDVFGISKPFLKEINADPNLSKQVVSGPGTGSFYMGFNTKKAPFDNVKVRQAFSLSIDRQGFVKDLLADIGIPANQFIPTKLPGHYDDLKDTYQKHDPQAAQKLLADAGFAGGKGLPAIKWTYSQNAVTQTRIEALAGYIKDALGVTISFDPVEPKAYTALVKKPETTPPLFYLGWIQDYPDPQDWYSTVFESSSTVSHVGWKNDQYDTLCQQADHELDKAKRESMYKQAAQILNDDAPVGFIFFSLTKSLIKPSITGYQVDPTEYFFGQHVLYKMKYTPAS